MRSVRAAWRLTAVAGLTLVCYLTWISGALLTRPWPAVRWRWRNRIFGGWSQGCLRLLAIRVTTTGAAPAAPFLMVCNHLSYVDILVLASRVGTVFVAKSEVAKWPVFGTLCRSIGTLFADRSSRRDIPRVMREMEAELAAGHSVLLFPEGTSTAGATVAPLKPALLAAAAQLELPVAYAVLGYRVPAGEIPAHLSICWWGDMTLLPHLWTLARLSRGEARLEFGPEPIRDADRKELARRLHAAISDRFQPTVTPEEVA